MGINQDSNDELQRDLGWQPIHHLLDELGLGNSDLVSASTEQLTHKQVQKARKGRRLTANLQKKVKKGLEAALKERGTLRSFRMEELFNYVP